MKKILSMVLASALALCLAACGGQNAASEASEASAAAAVPTAQSVQDAPLTGGWEATADWTISPELQEVFDKAMEGLEGVDYTPVACLGTQVVSGTNYCLMCQARTAAPDAAPYYALVYLYEDLEGNAQILNIAQVDLAAGNQGETN